MHRSKRTRIAALAAVLAVGSCVELPAEPPGTSRAPIVNGTLDTTHPGVGALLIDVGGGASGLCTGTTIADGWVLTAGHCVADADPADLMFALGDDFEAPDAEWYAVRAIHLHPAYVAPGTGPAENDLALLSVAGLSGVPISERSHTAPGSGLALTWVGYGITNAATGTGSGRRRFGSGTLAELFPTHYTYLFEGAMPCIGDSGGPAFAMIGGAERLVGVVAFGDESCGTMGLDTRVDAYAAWIDAVLAGAGDCDPTGGDCADGACLPAGDGDGYFCVNSDGIEVGGGCNADASSWETSVPCADGAYCVQVSADPRDGICHALCRGDGDCRTDEHCEIPLFAGIEDLGVCRPTGTTDADADPDADADADPDADADADPDADSDAALDVPADDTVPPVDGTGDAAGDAPAGGEGDDGCGCRAIAAPGSAAWPAACLLLGLWAGRRARVRRR